MSYGTNLSAILGILKINYRDAADKIGISYNTLSNIQNDRFSPSEDTKKKIASFLSLYGFSEKDLEREEKVFQNIRIRSSKQLSGLEKSQFRDDFHKFSEILEKSDSNKLDWIDYFECCDRPTEELDQETLWHRRDSLIQALKKSGKKGLFKIILEYYQDFSKGWVMVDTYNPVKITFLLDSLGIRRFFIPLRTEKISSFSTSLTSEYTTPFSYLAKDPVIVINTRVCNTTEKCLFEMAKQFYYMISSQNEYTFLSANKIELENKEKEQKAIKFAEKIMIHPEVLSHYIQERKRWFPSISPIDKKHSEFFFKNYDFSYIINEIKRAFRVGYELAIKTLFETDFEYLIYFDNIEQATQFYFVCLKRHDEEYQDKIVYLNGEPEPLPSAFRGYDSTIMPTVAEE